MADRITIDGAFVTAHINRLKIAYPELVEDAELLASTIEGETDFERVLDGVVETFLDARSMADAACIRIDSLRERADRFERKAEAMRALAFGMMNAADQRTILLSQATLSRREGMRSVVVDDAAVLPQGFVRIERVPIKTEIKKSLEAGETVPGAHLETGSAILSIRTK